MIREMQELIEKRSGYEDSHFVDATLTSCQSGNIRYSLSKPPVKMKPGLHKL